MTDVRKNVVELIRMNEIEKVYVGKDGCRCGCGGKYYYHDPDDLDGPMYDMVIQALDAVDSGAKVSIEAPAGVLNWINVECNPDLVYTIYFK